MILKDIQALEKAIVELVKDHQKNHVFPIVIISNWESKMIQIQMG